MANEITAIQFDREATMFAWLADESKMQDLQRQYPPGQYSARMDMVNRRVLVTPTEAPPSPATDNIEKLNAGQVAAICEILADVIDGGRYYFYEGTPVDSGALVTEAGANDDRLDFIAEVRRLIYAKAAPGTATRTAIGGQP